LKNPKISNFMKIRLVGTELFHDGGATDRQTDVTNLIIAFRNFVNVPQNEVLIHVPIYKRLSVYIGP
jgi:hypothetical protein